MPNDPEWAGYPPSIIDDKGIARLEQPMTGSSGRGPAGHQGAAVGRIVLYYRQFHALVPTREKAPQAAIITEVHGEGFVGLEVFGMPEKVLHRGVPFHPSPRSGCWTWLPKD
jgi:hypothetical protein